MGCKCAVEGKREVKDESASFCLSRLNSVLITEWVLMNIEVANGTRGDLNDLMITIPDILSH